MCVAAIRLLLAVVTSTFQIHHQANRKHIETENAKHEQTTFDSSLGKMHRQPQTVPSTHSYTVALDELHPNASLIKKKPETKYEQQNQTLKNNWISKSLQ